MELDSETQGKRIHLQLYLKHHEFSIIIQLGPLVDSHENLT